MRIAEIIHEQDKEVFSNVFQDGGWKIYLVDGRFQIVCYPMFGGEEERIFPLYETLEKAKEFAFATFT